MVFFLFSQIIMAQDDHGAHEIGMNDDGDEPIIFKIRMDNNCWRIDLWDHKRQK